MITTPVKAIQILFAEKKTFIGNATCSSATATTFSSSYQGTRRTKIKDAEEARLWQEKVEAKKRARREMF